MKLLQVNTDLMVHNQIKVDPHQLINRLYKEQFNPFVGKNCILLIYWWQWPRAAVENKLKLHHWKEWIIWLLYTNQQHNRGMFLEAIKKRLKQDYIFPRVALPALIILSVLPTKVGSLVLVTQITNKICTYPLLHYWKYLAEQAWCDWANIFYILPFHTLWQPKHANGWLHPLHDKD